MVDWAKARHQPGCPACGYLMIGEMEHNTHALRCPECGERFTRDDIRWIRRPRENDWTVAQGLRLASGALAFRIAITILLFASMLWVLSPALLAFPPSGRGLTAHAIILVLPSLLVGHLISRKLTEIAGFESIILTIMACAAASIAIYTSIEIVAARRSIQHMSTFLFAGPSLVAYGWIVRNMHFAD